MKLFKTHGDGEKFIHHITIANNNRSSKRSSMPLQNINKLIQKLKVIKSADYQDGYLVSSLQMLEKKGFDHLSITLAIPSFPTSHVKLDDIFCQEENRSRESFHSSLEFYIKQLIDFETDIPQEIKEKLKENMDKSYYYSVFKISGKSCLFETSNMSKYFSYCARNDMSPNLFVHFLCNYVEIVQFNPVA